MANYKHQPCCPKCRQKPWLFREVWNNFEIQFDAEEGDGCPEGEGVKVDGQPVHVIAVCQCGHEWRLRGIAQITEVRDLWADGKG